MDESEYAEWLSQFDFTFSKTYARKGAPHEYLSVDDLPEANRQTWYEFVVYVRVNGRTMEFWGSDYTVCDVGDYTYWTMGNSLSVTSVLNRKPTDGYDEYVETESPSPGVNEV
jgi:hypothetical protein